LSIGRRREGYRLCLDGIGRRRRKGYLLGEGCILCLVAWIRRRAGLTLCLAGREEEIRLFVVSGLQEEEEDKIT
jgi:hypothetical protein